MPGLFREGLAIQARQPLRLRPVLSKRSAASPEALYGVCVGPTGTLVAVGASGGVDALILSSADGITWTERTNPKNVGLFQVTYALGLFVAVGEPDGIDTYTLTSPDGITWTERATPQNRGLIDVVASPTTLVAVGDFDGVDAYIASSANGTAWTERANPSAKGLGAVTYAPELGLFCAVGGLNFGASYIVTSPDGAVWTARTDPAGGEMIQGVVWAGNQFVASGYTPGGASAYVIASADGITWRVLPDNLRTIGSWSLYSMCWTGSRIVAVNPLGLLESRNGEQWSWVRYSFADYSDVGGLCWTGALRSTPSLPITNRGRLISLGYGFNENSLIAVSGDRPRAVGIR